jgi:hypothetical protein
MPRPVPAALPAHPPQAASVQRARRRHTPAGGHVPDPGAPVPAGGGGIMHALHDGGAAGRLRDGGAAGRVRDGDVADRVPAAAVLGWGAEPGAEEYVRMAAAAEATHMRVMAAATA